MHASLVRRSAARRTAALVAALLLAAAPARAQRDSAFMQEYRKLMVVNAKDEMGALIKKHEHEAILAIREIAVLMRDGSSEELEVEFDALRRGWEKAYDSQFATMQYDYFALRLTGPFRKQHKDTSTKHALKYKEYETVTQAKEVAKYPQLSVDFEMLGDQFTELGDFYEASQAYWNAAALADEELAGDKADKRRAWKCWGMVVKAREEAALKDKQYEIAKARVTLLEGQGFSGPDDGTPAAPEAGGGGEPSGAPAPSVAATPFGGTFALIPDIEAIQRPLYTADSNFQIWVPVGMQKIGSSGKFHALEGSTSVVRSGANKAAVDVNADGTGEVDIPLTGKIMPVEVTLADGRKWGFLAAIGQQQDVYQGFRFNLQPDENQMSLYVAPAASLVGTINAQRVQVIDDNMDGVYGSPPKDWTHMGLLDGAVQHDVDSIVVGEAKFARPWSRLTQIGDAWFELESDPASNEVLYRPATVQTGTLQLDFKGAPVVWLVVRGMGEERKDLFFDVANGGTNKVQVPVGSYELYSGLVASGKKAQMAKALVMQGTNTRSWKVGAGETIKVELGAPFSFDFAVTQDEETVTVQGPSVVAVGRGGETYQRLWNCVLTPEVNLRKAGTSRGKKEKELVPISSQEELETVEWDFRAVWFPVGEPIKKPSPGDTCEVQLFQKKHKLFGKIESDWKGG